MFPAYSFSGFMELKNRIRNRFKNPVILPDDNERVITILPEGSTGISVETALNSRCTSDYDDAQELSHWGLFNKNEKLSPDQIELVASYIKVPRYTKHHAEILVNKNVFTFIYDNTVSGIEKDWLMIESGMQQQAVCLVSAALGVGVVIKALGKNGKKISETNHSILKIKLDAMKPSYSKSYWTTRPPEGMRPWLVGNLPTPDRIGKTSLLDTISDLSHRKKGTNELTESFLSQLLWAARGRTPHLYKSRAWGMTIPTSRGEQNNTNVNLLEKNRLSQYVNWSGNRPTHSLKKINDISHDIYVRLNKILPHRKYSIILSGNSHSEKICMETGYQLLNILLQAKSLNLTYSTLLLDEKQKNIVKKTGINNPIAIVSL